MKKLPDYIFDRSYEKFYLFTEYDIIFNVSFYKKLIIFMRTLKSNSLTFEICESDDSNVSNERQIKYSVEFGSLIEFYDENISYDENHNSFPTHLIDHYLFDEKKGWQFFISCENELALFGCNNDNDNIFNAIFNPYQEESLETKLKIIGDMFNDEEVKYAFLSNLKKNYTF